MSWLSGAIWAQQALEYPRPCPNGCQPKVGVWGYSQTKWRQWPETRLEQINPHAPGSEIIRTPEGREELPVPKAAMPQPQPRQPQPGQPQPGQPQPPSKEENELPQGGMILPPEGTLLPRNELGGPETKPKSTKPSTEGELPGLPPEPEPSPSGKDIIPPPKAPSKPAAEKPQKTSRSGDGLKPRELPEATMVIPAQPANSHLVRLGVWQGSGQPTASAATPLAAGGARADAVVALAGSMEPERNALLPGAYRADAIEVAPNAPVREVEPAAYATAESPAKREVVNRAGVPSVALGGYCPVELSGNGRWVLGDLRWTVVYRGWIYRLSGAEQRQQFLADPNRFAPVNSGNDVVLSVDTNRNVPGQPAYCATYNNRLYMFSSAATQAEFNRNPERYATRK